MTDLVCFDYFAASQAAHNSLSVELSATVC